MVIPSGRLMVMRLLHPSKAPSSEENDSGSEMVVRLVYRPKVASSLVIPSGRLMVVSLLHPFR